VPNSIQGNIEYFFSEGKENLDECLRIAFDTALLRDVKKLVIFTGVGLGPKIAIEKFLCQEIYKDVSIVAVTFPYGQLFSAEGRQISKEDRQLFKRHNIPIIRAHLPFNPIAAHHRAHGMLGQDLSLIGNALSMFCGSMSLCVQAAIMACDAGEVELGEHVIALTSDTAILVRCCPTEQLLTDFIIREVLCKPMSLTIIKKEKGLEAPPSQLTLEGIIDSPAPHKPEPELLPPPSK
jgi:uncharacterized protein